MNSGLITLGSVLLLCAMCMNDLSAQTQTIQFDYTSGNVVDYALEDVSKITYTQETLSLHFVNGSVFVWDLNTINFYRYEQVTSVIEHAVKSANEIEMNLYPNPSRGEVNIGYSLQNAAHVRVDWYSMTGMYIETVWDGEQPAGEHLIQWMADGLSNGTYLCRISTADFSLSKPIILNR